MHTLRLSSPATLTLTMLMLVSPACTLPGGPALQQPDDRGPVTYGAYNDSRPVNEADTFRLLMEGNIGDGDLDIDGSRPNPLDTSDDAVRLRATGEGYFGEDRMLGFGVTVEGWRNNDTTFADGVTNGELERISITPHLSLQSSPSDIFQVRGRIGPSFSAHTLLDNSTAAEVEYYSLGLRFEVEPELYVIRTRNADFSFFARGTFGAYSTLIETDAVPDEEFFTNTGDIHGTVGGRLRIQNLLLMAGYTWERTFFDESDVENGLFILDTEFGFEGLMFGGGIVF